MESIFSHLLFRATRLAGCFGLRGRETLILIHDLNITSGHQINFSDRSRKLMAANNTSLRFLGADEVSKSLMITQTFPCVSFIGNIL